MHIAVAWLDVQVAVLQFTVDVHQSSFMCLGTKQLQLEMT